MASWISWLSHFLWMANMAASNMRFGYDGFCNCCGSPWHFSVWKEHCLWRCMISNILVAFNVIFSHDVWGADNFPHWNSGRGDGMCWFPLMFWLPLCTSLIMVTLNLWRVVKIARSVKCFFFSRCFAYPFYFIDNGRCYPLECSKNR